MLFSQCKCSSRAGGGCQPWGSSRIPHWDLESTQGWGWLPGRLGGMLCARENLLFHLSISDVHDSTTNCRHTLCQNITNIKMRTNLPTAKGTACSSVVSHILQEQEATVKLQLHRSARAKSPILSSAWNHHSCVSVPSLLCEAPQT